jgi:plasmid stability protein
MADVKIRNLDDLVYETYRQRAEQRGVSLEEELRRALRDNLQAERKAWAEHLREEHRKFREQFGELPESWPGIRKDRDTRG